MFLLLVVSFIWAFSFGLIKKLAGIDSTAIAVLRLAISLAVFLPFLRVRGLRLGGAARLALIGAVQFGAVYYFYLKAYAHLHAYEVALFTITTPLLVTVIDSLLQRRLSGRHALAALLSVLGAAVVLWKTIGDTGIVAGFLLVQLSNLCFAAGQLAWRRERSLHPSGTGDDAVFAVLYAGGLLLTLVMSAFTTDWRAFAATPFQWEIICYLGAVASGLGFFLWNVGAARVNAGVLAAFNNAKIPLGIACSLIFFGEHADPLRLVGGGLVMALGVWVATGREATTVS